ncbi:enoyl-CoA hydratase [Pseudoroseomonas rhizosphaerae]|jgi:E-phenylitaconyl-CoA hydratase|uniref:Enoyl-CoA hydratase n=1 Tax=Teichococcus rhizosphaerae TaxID=1335062 RepID=A0A2C6Y0T6_9PROT|nr:MULTISPECIES: enoyl-CoA hydratase/isomerase family protein [Acetobacteraceae]PHK94402.1 enoyl-CoA hydratase [Pseudoroseomonas rhizosphaerae]
MSIDLDIDAEGIATITINRPERRNALDAAHYAGLTDAWMRVRDDPAVRCAIVTGAGDKSFSAGADIKDFIGRRQELSDHWLTQKGQLLNRGLEVWKPVIAAVNGFCVGGGMTLLLATDIRIAVPHATFGLSEVKRGVIAGNGGTQRVMRQLPHAIAMEMLLTGDAIDAARAERWGLVNAVVPPEELMPAARAFARRIAANAPLAVQAAKELGLRSRDMPLADGLRLEQMVSRILQGSEDVKEGRAAFAEKRPPRFEGR